MNGRKKFWGVLGLFVALVMGAVAVVVWQAMEGVTALDDQAFGWLQKQLVLAMSLLFCLGAVLVHIWAWLDRVLLKPLANVSHALEVMTHLDPLGPIHLEPGNLLGSLPHTAQQLGESLFHARRQVREVLANSAPQMERLETVVKYFPVGFVVINAQGTIILYNQAAQNLFRQRQDYLGLGQSLYHLCARIPVETTMELLRREKTTDGLIQGGVQFYCAGMDNAVMLDCTMSSFPGDAEETLYFTITFAEVTSKVAARRWNEQLIRFVLEDMRSPMANLQAAAETLVHNADMDASTQKGLMQVVLEEGRAISRQLEQMAWEANTLPLGRGENLVDILTSDLFAALARQLEKYPRPVLNGVGEPLWIHADVPALLMVLAVLMQKIADNTGTSEIEAQALMGNHRIYLDFIWPGIPIPAHEVENWLRLELPLGGSVTSLEEILRRHGGDLWSQRHRQPGYAMLRLPVAPSSRQWQPLLQTIQERPEFYDFSLIKPFEMLGRKVGLGLDKLTYVVFDTETTGMQPSKGDEIISIAAVRIVNGRILLGESFSRLINPGRTIPAESTRIHGITQEDVKNMPMIDEVLPQFRSFIGDSVVVAHNAAFDMRFLQLKEARLGIRFDSPVLDTLLISVYLHEEATDHTLDAIARRLGVEIRGRHTAMGDTLVTAEVFLKLIHLLKTRGITSLGLTMKLSESMVQIRRQQARANY
ncbi:MAG: exonuclease domain-containing protein [Magnetococcus sp. THC-1_WYH]